MSAVSLPLTHRWVRGRETADISDYIFRLPWGQCDFCPPATLTKNNWHCLLLKFVIILAVGSCNNALSYFVTSLQKLKKVVIS